MFGIRPNPNYTPGTVYKSDILQKLVNPIRQGGHLIHIHKSYCFGSKRQYLFNHIKLCLRVWKKFAKFYHLKKMSFLSSNKKSLDIKEIKKNLTKQSFRWN